MAPRLAALTLAAALAVTSCGDPSRPDVVGTAHIPAGPRAGLTGLPACQRSDARLLQQEVGALFSDAATRREARRLEGIVEDQCAGGIGLDGKVLPHPNVATNAAIDYLAFLLAQRGAKLATDEFYWGHVVRLFAYVGYALPTSASVLSTSGFVGICTPRDDCPGIAADGERGIKIFAGALGDAATDTRYVLTLAPADCATAVPSAYPFARTGLCADVSVDPKQTASFDFKKKPGAIVDVCTNPGVMSYIYQSLTDPYGGSVVQGRLAQRSPTAVGFTPVSLRQRPSQGLLVPARCGLQQPKVGQTTDPGALARWSDALAALFTPAIAHASHGGLGTLPGFADDLSLFGAVDGYLFNATFEQDPVGTYPQKRDELRGSWEPSLGPNPSPSVVTVQAPAPPFSSRFALLNQAGGNAASKDSLTLTGRLPFDATAYEAGHAVTFRVRVRAAVLSPRAQDASLILRASTGAELGRIVFTDGTPSQSGPIVFRTPDGATPTAAGAGWAQHALRELEAVVTFTRGGASGALSKVQVTLGFPGQVVRTYVFEAPSTIPPDLRELRWHLGGKDGAALGFDDLQVFVEPVGAVP